MGKVKKELDDLAGKAGETGSVFDNSFTNARGGLMLTEDLVGVRLPRHLNSLIAQIPGVSAVFSAMLPIVGAPLALEIIAKLITKHEELAKAIQKAAQEATNQAVKEADQTKALELTNLKLDDQIARLEHKPSHNYLKEAILETSQEVDKLASSFSADFAKINESITDDLGFWNSLGRGIEDAWSGKGQGKGYGTVTAGLEKVRAAMNDTENARRKLADAQAISPDGKATVEMQALADAVKAQENAFVAAIPTMKDNRDELAYVTRGAASAAAEYKNLALALQAGQKKEKIAGLEQGEANLKPLKDEAELQKIAAQGVAEHAQALSKLAQTQAETALAAAKTAGQSPEQQAQDEIKAVQIARDAQIADANAVLTAKKAAYDADVKAAGNDAAKKKELDAQYKNAVQANADAVAQINAEAQKHITEITTSETNKRKEDEIRATQEAADGVLRVDLKAAKDREEAAMKEAKAQEQLHKKTAQQTLQDQIKAINDERDAEVKAYQDRIKALDKFDADYKKKVQAFENEIEKINKTADDQITAEKTAAAIEQAQRIQQAETRMEESIADSVSKSIVENKNLAASMRKTGEEMIEQMLKNLIMAEIFGQRKKLIDARQAAADAFASAGNPILGAVLAAGAFAAVMSFEIGGKIPGAGPVPIVGHGGETVVTKALTDRVERAESGGNSGGGMTMHAHFAPVIHAIDGDGVDAMLKKHGSRFQRNIEATIRKYNRGN